MALSKTYVRPIFPKDISNNQREARAADNSAFTPGTLVVRVSGKIVACDIDTASHRTLPAELVWTDGSQRQDIERVNKDGTVEEEYTTLAGGTFVMELASSLFTATPVAGDLICKSATAGKLDPLTETELQTAEGGTAASASTATVARVVGRVVGAADTSGFYVCHVSLG